MKFGLLIFIFLFLVSCVRKNRVLHSEIRNLKNQTKWYLYNLYYNDTALISIDSLHTDTNHSIGELDFRLDSVYYQSNDLIVLQYKLYFDSFKVPILRKKNYRYLNSAVGIDTIHNRLQWVCFQPCKGKNLFSQMFDKNTQDSVITEVKKNKYSFNEHGRFHLFNKNLKYYQFFDTALNSYFLKVGNRANSWFYDEYLRRKSTYSKIK